MAATEGIVELSTATSVVEGVLQRNGKLFSDDLASRKGQEISLRRYEATRWLRKMLGVVKARDLPAEPSEEHFRRGLRNGIILCSVLNKVQPGAVQKVVEAPHENLQNFLVVVEEMGLPVFEASDLEKEGNSSRIVNCVLALKSYNEEKQKVEADSKPSPTTKQLVRKTSDPFMNLLSRNSSVISGTLHTLVEDLLSDKRQEDIPFIVESMLSKVMEEFEHHIASQNEQLEVFRKDAAVSTQQLEAFRKDAAVATQQLEALRKEAAVSIPKESALEITPGNSEVVLVQKEEKASSEAVQTEEKAAPEVVQTKEKAASGVAQTEEKAAPEVVQTKEKAAPEVDQTEEKAASEVDQTEEKAASIGISDSVEINDGGSKEQDLRMLMLAEQKEQDLRKQMLAEQKEQELRKQMLVEQKEQELRKQMLVEQKEQERRALMLVEQKEQEVRKLMLAEQKEQDLRKLMLVEQQHRHVEELKCTLHATKADLQLLQMKYQEEVSNLGTHLYGLTRAAAGYQKVLDENRKLYNQVQDLKGSIRVYCRVRPFMPGKPNGLTAIDNIDDGNITILTPSKNGKDAKKSFTFNKVFGSSATQGEVFADTQPLIRSVLDGYNVCIFAYGQTGSGKTYTMTGPNDLTTETMGVNYRALGDLFNISEQRKDVISYDISVQMMEIYNEQIRDLLAADGVNKKVDIRNSSQKGINVPDANLIPVRSTADVMHLMTLGHKNRTVSATAMNDRSSRSHSCLTVHVQGTNVTSGATIRGSMHLVDLAGSERVDKSKVIGDAFKEATHINKSLSALGDVISALAQKNAHVPYRNSKLTQLLQDSLGGQAKTLMFVHISPEPDAIGETISTLKFAERVSTVELGSAKANKDGSDVKELKEQIVSLKAALARKEGEQGQKSLSRSSTPERNSMGSSRSSSCHSLADLPSDSKQRPKDSNSYSEVKRKPASKTRR